MFGGGGGAALGSTSAERNLTRITTVFALIWIFTVVALEFPVGPLLRLRYPLYPTTSKWRNRQTRQLEGLVREISWGFKSPLRHCISPWSDWLQAVFQRNLVNDDEYRLQRAGNSRLRRRVIHHDTFLASSSTTASSRSKVVSDGITSVGT